MKRKDPTGNTKAKERKVTNGPVKSKARTMSKLIMAVGKVLNRKGYTGLTVSNIAKEAKVNRKLVYLYFGNAENLIEAYILGKDYWQFDAKNSIESILEKKNTGQEDLLMLLKNQFKAVFKNPELQKIILWEISESNALMQKIASERDKISDKLVQFVHPKLISEKVDLPAIVSLLIGGAYYLPIHATNNGSTICGIDINENVGEERVLRAFEQVINLCYNTIGE
ncbi:TetR/AcrR family transcriptional regulator [Parapedobacter koreensis]|nr:TetR/AcrR family transcriptional regulator [Parapedobacter koreensis]